MISKLKHADRISKIIQNAATKVEESQIELLTIFIRQFYEDVVWSDFEKRDIDALTGSVVSLWHLMHKRKRGEIQIKVFNPNLKKDGWKCDKTIILINQNDIPFLVDSLQMALNKQGLRIFSIIHLGGIHTSRNAEGKIIQLAPLKSNIALEMIEAPIYIEIAKQTDPDNIKNLKTNLESILLDVKLIVADWPKMKEKLKEVIGQLNNLNKQQNTQKSDEPQRFLQWLLEENFVFFGYRKFEIIKNANNEKELQMAKGSELGVFAKKTHDKVNIKFKDFSPIALKNLTSSLPLILYKTNTLSTIHRDTYTDSIVIKCFDKDRNLIGLHRFIGLYATIVYNSSIKHIPILRDKVEKLLAKFGYPRDGYAAKTLINIFEKLPRDDFFQADIDELYQDHFGYFPNPREKDDPVICL